MAPLGDGVELLIGARSDTHSVPFLLAGAGDVYTESCSATRQVALAPTTHAHTDR